MATTDIHAIKQTVGVAIGYITKDKVEEKIKDDIADSIKYGVAQLTDRLGAAPKVSEFPVIF